MICGTFILAFQNIVAKTVERNVPPMQVVFVRSLLSGMVTFGTITADTPPRQTTTETRA